MRPVNLIPPEDRRGDRAPLRAGSLSYVLMAGLALALVGVTVLVLTGNSISESKTQVSELEAREAAATAEAESLSAFAEFASTSQARAVTVESLAHSRFDWERVLRELALVIPDDIWLVELTGTAAPGVQIDSGTSVSIQGELPGPSLAMVGCGDGHEAVARFLQALKDIDGVTRVGISKSELKTSPDASGGAGNDCRTRDFISRFEVVVAFDEVAVPATAAPAPAEPAAPPSGDGSGLAEADAERQQANDSAAEQTNESKQATNLVPGVAK